MGLEAHAKPDKTRQVQSTNFIRLCMQDYKSPAHFMHVDYYWVHCIVS